MARDLDPQQQADLTEFVNAIADLAGYTTTAEWARESGYPASNLSNLRNAATMAAYWKDVRLLFARVKGAKPVVVHVEPDLWGYLEQAGATAFAAPPAYNPG